MFRALSTITIAAAAGYLAARQLLADDAPQRIESLPEPARRPALAARRRLVAARERARIALNEGRAERMAAEAELTARYRDQAGRTTDVTQLPRGL